jgi:hypothetical protein
MLGIIFSTTNSAFIWGVNTTFVFDFFVVAAAAGVTYKQHAIPGGKMVFSTTYLLSPTTTTADRNISSRKERRAQRGGIYVKTHHHRRCSPEQAPFASGRRRFFRPLQEATSGGCLCITRLGPAAKHCSLKSGMLSPRGGLGHFAGASLSRHSLSLENFLLAERIQFTLFYRFAPRS